MLSDKPFYYLALALEAIAGIIDGRWVGSQSKRLSNLPAIQNTSFMVRKGSTAVMNILPKKSTVVNLSTSAFAMMFGRTSSTSWPNEGLKAPTVASMAALQYLTDTIPHNEAARESRNQQEALVALFAKLSSLIQEKKVAKYSWNKFIITEEQDLYKLWKNNAYLLITLKDGCGTIIIPNDGHATNKNKMLHNLTGVVAFALLGANIYMLASEHPDSKVDATFPTYAPTSVQDSSTLDTEAQIGEIAVFPFHLVLDSIHESCQLFKKGTSSCIESILNALEKKLVSQKAINEPASPDFPEELIATITLLGLQGEFGSRALELKAQYKDYATFLKIFLHNKELEQLAEELEELSKQNDTLQRETVANKFISIVQRASKSTSQKTVDELKIENQKFKTIIELVNRILIDALNGNPDIARNLLTALQGSIDPKDNFIDNLIVNLDRAVGALKDHSSSKASLNTKDRVPPVITSFNKPGTGVTTTLAPLGDQFDDDEFDIESPGRRHFRPARNDT